MKKELHILHCTFKHRGTIVQNDCYMKCKGVLRGKNWIRNAICTLKGHTTLIQHHRNCRPRICVPKAEQTACCTSIYFFPPRKKNKAQLGCTGLLVGLHSVQAPPGPRHPGTGGEGLQQGPLPGRSRRSRRRRGPFPPLSCCCRALCTQRQW